MEAPLKAMSFPAGYSYTFDGGDYQNDGEAMPSRHRGVVAGALICRLPA